MVGRTKELAQLLAKHRALEFLLPLVFFLLIFFYFPFRDRFEFDPDEGVNAMKALLLARGFPLYIEVWSDQPPFFTYLLAIWFRLLGFNIDTGRAFVLLLSSSLLGAASFSLRLTWGIWHALAAAILLLLLPYYNSLSVSVMIGLPALAFAVFSLLFLTLWHQRHQSFWLALSALALSLSLLTKLFTAFLAPIFLLGILIEQLARRKPGASLFKLIQPAILWGLVFAAATFLLGFFLVGPDNLSQLLDTHLAGQHAGLYPDFSMTEVITWYLRESWSFLFLALLGILFTVLSKQWLSLYWFAWAVSGYLFLVYQVPVRYHHQLLVTIPATILAAIAVGEVVRILIKTFLQHDHFKPYNLLIIPAIIGFVFILISRAPVTYYSFRLPAYLIEPAAPPPDKELSILAELYRYADSTQWVVTDLPMYAFRAQLPVPPYQAVITEKRIATGNLSEEQIIDIIDEYKPEQVLIGRFKLDELEEFLREDYRRNYFWGRKHLYLLGELKRNP